MGPQVGRGGGGSLGLISFAMSGPQLLLPANCEGHGEVVFWAMLSTGFFDEAEMWPHFINIFLKRGLILRTSGCPGPGVGRL